MRSKKKSAAKSDSNKTPFRQLRLSEDSPFGMKEAYNALRTKVIFSLPGVTNAVIGITSTGRSEGKSSSAVNLAISFSAIGKRVLIIDGDLRLPTVATKMNVKGVPGLSDCLVGLAAMRDCLRKSTYAEIDILPAGNIPPNPTKLLQSEQMSEILQSAREHYDYVIVDLPPINTVTDAALISQDLDGYLLVVRHNQTEFKQIESMLKELELVNAKILGFVYNDVPADKKGYYKSYYKK